MSLDSTISQNLIYIDFILKVSLERHLQSPKNWIYTKSIIKKKNGLILFHNFHIQLKILKQFPRKWIYTKGVS